MNSEKPPAFGFSPSRDTLRALGAHPVDRKPTEPQLRQLRHAAADARGLIHSVPINGLGAKARRVMMGRMVLLGWFTEYVHGGWEITPAGRAIVEAHSE